MSSRTHASFTVFDLIRLKGGFMVRVGDNSELRDQIRTQLEYLGMLARSNRAIGHMLYLENFCLDGQKTSPLLDNGNLNKIAFEYVNRNKMDHTLNQANIIDSFGGQAAKRLLDQQEKRLNRAIEWETRASERHLASYAAKLQDAGGHYGEYESALATRINLLEQLDALEENNDGDGDEPKIVGELRKIASSGSWILFYIDDDGFADFYSAADIICSHTNPAAGVNMSVNMGRYTVRVNLSHSKISLVGKLYNNIGISSRSFGSVIHPHSTTRSICWGSARQDVEQAALDGNLVRQFNLLDELLACYSPSNPYAALRTFNRHRANRMCTELNYDEYPQWMLQDILGDKYDEQKWIDLHETEEGEAQEREDNTTQQDDGVSEEDRFHREYAAQAAIRETERWVLPTTENLRGSSTEGYIIDELPAFTPARVVSEDNVDIPF